MQTRFSYLLLLRTTTHSRSIMYANYVQWNLRKHIRKFHAFESPSIHMGGATLHEQQKYWMEEPGADGSHLLGVCSGADARLRLGCGTFPREWTRAPSATIQPSEIYGWRLMVTSSRFTAYAEFPLE